MGGIANSQGLRGKDSRAMMVAVTGNSQPAAPVPPSGAAFISPIGFQRQERSWHRHLKSVDPHRRAGGDELRGELDHCVGLSIANVTAKNFDAGPRDATRSRGNAPSRRDGFLGESD